MRYENKLILLGIVIVGIYLMWSINDPVLEYVLAWEPEEEVTVQDMIRQNTVQRDTVSQDGQKEEPIMIQHTKLVGIPLSAELQNYLHDLCYYYDLDFYMVLGLIDHETGGTFNPNTVGVTGDVGLMQINPRYADELAERAGLKVYDLFNPKQNILIGVHHLLYLRRYWTIEEGLEGQALWEAVLSSYNRGINGHYNKIATYYVSRIWKLREQYI